MGHQSSGVDFAFIGHQESWQKVERFVEITRKEAGLASISSQQTRALYPYLPPRPLFEFEVQSVLGKKARGMYIESFISPDELDIKFIRGNLQKIKDACDVAIQSRIPIASLGGLTSILLEANGLAVEHCGNTHFTTGNTLTTAFIADGIETCCKLLSVSLAACNLLIIGSTGDIGSACSRYFAGRAKSLLLHARQEAALKKQWDALHQMGVTARWSANINDLLPNADIVICVASSVLLQCDATLLSPDAIVCDAGYPKNLEHSFSGKLQHYLQGGMGIAAAGADTIPNSYKTIYEFAVPDVAHGCLLEAATLALEGRATSFSAGRGNITAAAIDEIKQMAARHGITAALPFDHNGYWSNLKSTINNETITQRTGSFV